MAGGFSSTMETPVLDWTEQLMDVELPLVESIGSQQTSQPSEHGSESTRISGESLEYKEFAQ